jgi:uncharacterized protein
VAARTNDGRVHFGVARVDLLLPGVSSLKGKRALLNRAKAALQRALDVSVAEVADQELWQRASLGIAVAASSATGVDRVLDRVVAVIERDPAIEVLGIAELTDTLDADPAPPLPG